MEATSLPIHCAHTDVVDPTSLYPHPKNPNEHPDEQIKVFAGILRYQGWRRPITVSRRSGFITKGHGALKTALTMGLTEVPIDYQDYADEGQELADIVADNQLQRLSVMNVGKLNTIVSDLKGFTVNLEMTGFKLDSLQSFLDAPKAGDGSITDQDDEDQEERYTKKVKSPIYEPKGEKPDVGGLVDIETVNTLLLDIEKNSSLSDGEKLFLRFAAWRHAVFNYERIAEYYAHASPEVQRLMEASALVIIDFNQAIERGFVVLSEELAEAYRG